MPTTMRAFSQRQAPIRVHWEKGVYSQRWSLLAKCGSSIAIRQPKHRSHSMSDVFGQCISWFSLSRSYEHNDDNSAPSGNRPHYSKMRLKRAGGSSEGWRFPIAHTIFLVATTNILTGWTVHNVMRGPVGSVSTIHTPVQPQQQVEQPEISKCPPPPPTVAARAIPATLSDNNQATLPERIPATQSTSVSLKPARNSARIYCMMPSSVSVHQARNGMRAFDFVLATWGHRCDVLKFFAGHADGMPTWYTPNLQNKQTEPLFMTGENPHPGAKGAAIVSIDMSRNDCNNKNDPKCRNIWEKVWKSWAYVWKHDLDTADWFLKVDYDSYLFVDNLKDFLRPLNPNEELYLGHNVYQHVPKGGPVFNQGGATVFSHATMNTMGKKFQNMESKRGAQYTWTSECVDRDGAQEEWGIANCLRSMNITATNTADEHMRERFLPFQMHCHLRLLRKDGPTGWYWLGKPDFVRDGINCCADDLIVVHGYKADAYTDIVRWFEYEHFERSYQNVKRQALEAQFELSKLRQQALPSATSLE